MQATETKHEGLKREFAVKLPASAVNDEIESQLRSMGSRVKIPGFRPGHIPLTVLKKRFGKNVLGEVIERTVNQSSQKVLKDHNLRPAMPPKIEITSYQEGGDLDFKIELETMPEVPAMDFGHIKLEKLVCEPEEQEMDEAVARLLERNTTYAPAEDKQAKAEKGDQVLIDFAGTKDGVAFEGGTAKGFELVLGSNQFIAGFEEQLIGNKAGDEVTVKVTFPDAYHKADLAGQPAEFAVTVHEVRKGTKSEANDAFAKKLGFADLAAMRKAVRDQFAGDYDSAARGHMKKQLFDTLEAECNFVTPQAMVDLEFKSIWDKIEQARKEGDESLLAKGDEELQGEYRKIAERRVKLGILLSDIAAKNKIIINQDELSRAVMQQASQYPGQERKVFEFYQKNPRQLEELRGPILEEKAVDFILGKAAVTERKVTREELTRETEAQEDLDEMPAQKSPVKKTVNE